MSLRESPCSGRGRTSRLPQHQPPLRWPSQSHVAPFSWLLTRDVEQGRDELNFSTWDSNDGEADDAADAVAEASMPPRRYVLVHPDAALSQAERQVLVDALEAMDRARGGGDRSGPGGGGDDGNSGPGGGG
jgi:hypothetical protein